jgi:hypothetical protein
MSVWAPSKTQSYQLPEETARTFPARLVIRRRPLLWLNLTCLDAPIVALLWQAIFAQAFHIELSDTSRVALFLTAWLIYLSDRFADAIALPLAVPRSLRQEICLRYQGLWVTLLGLIAALDGFVVCSRLDHQIFIRGLWLGSVAAIYLGANYLFGKLWRFLPLKEIAIGFLFAAGTLFVLATQWSVTSLLLFTAFLFACLCSLNCMSIAIWERDLDREQDKYSIATQWSAAKFYIRVALFILTMICIALAIFDDDLRPLTVCLGLSSVFLGGLHFLPLLTDERTALADLVMLTPLAWLFGQLLL